MNPTGAQDLHYWPLKFSLCPTCLPLFFIQGVATDTNTKHTPTQTERIKKVGGGAESGRKKDLRAKQGPKESSGQILFSF